MTYAGLTPCRIPGRGERAFTGKSLVQAHKNRMYAEDLIMMNTSVSLVTASVVMLLMLPGCSALEKSLTPYEIQREVRDNVFSSSYPAVKIALERDLVYLGNVRNSRNPEDYPTDRRTPGDGTCESASYLFGQTDEKNRLSRGVLIRVLVAWGDPNQPGQDRRSGGALDRHLLDSGKILILQEEYRFRLSVLPHLFTEGELNLLNGARAPRCMLVRELEKREGFGNKARTLVYYFEDASLSDREQAGVDCLSGSIPSVAQEDLIRDFTERSYQAIRFMKTGDTPEAGPRYEDAEKAEQSDHKGVQTSGTDGAGTVEKRLRSLKDLFEKDLITQEEYEQKKAEILKDL